MPARYRKKPRVIEAMRLNSVADLRTAWHWICLPNDDSPAGRAAILMEGRRKVGLAVKTLEGTMRAELGDWIIRGVAGEFYPCKHEVFVQTYEAVGDE
jgi:hypothetical protein